MKEPKIYVLKGYSVKKERAYTALCADIPINGKTHRIFLSSKNYLLYNELLEQMIASGNIIDET